MGSLSFSRVITAVGTKTVSSSKIRNNSLKMADACKLPYVWSLFNDGVHFFSPMIVSSFGPVSIFGTEIGDRKAVEKSYQNVENIDLRHKHIPQLMHGYGACLNLTLAALRVEKIWCKFVIMISKGRIRDILRNFRECRGERVVQIKVGGVLAQRSY